ncbi:MAG: hypothetical protein MJ051_07695 [Akkermansia sp.]|nr:hypothetical protein [Akkermansia sp.]
MFAGLFRSHRFTHDLWALSPWYSVAFLLFLAAAIPAIPDKYKPHLRLIAAILALIGFFTR